MSLQCQLSLLVLYKASALDLHHTMLSKQPTFKQSHREIYWSNLPMILTSSFRPPMPRVVSQNQTTWSRANNLKVNPAKCAEIIFVDKRRKTAVQHPLPMPNITRVTSYWKSLEVGVTLTNSLSVAEHVQAVISSYAQTLYALRMLRKIPTYRQYIDSIRCYCQTHTRIQRLVGLYQC